MNQKQSETMMISQVFEQTCDRILEQDVYTLDKAEELLKTYMIADMLRTHANVKVQAELRGIEQAKQLKISPYVYEGGAEENSAIDMFLDRMERSPVISSLKSLKKLIKK